MNRNIARCRICASYGMLLIFLNVPTNGQNPLDERSPNLYWVHAGVGGGSPGSAFGIGFSYCMSSTLVSARFNICPEGQVLDVSAPSPTEYVADFGILYGISTMNSDVFASIAAGAGLAFGMRRGQFLYNANYITKVYQEEPYSAFGIPLEAQFGWRFSSTWGMEVYGFAQLNHERSFGGGLLCVRCGLLQ